VNAAVLLLVSLGPVQDFIARARRTRDLWFGSHLLSELSRTAAKALADQGALLIFPALDLKNDAVEFEECKELVRPGGDTPPLSIANKILAEVPSGVDPAACARFVRGAVRDRWTRIADGVRNGRRGILAENAEQVWNEQINEALEFYAVWVPIGLDYRTARNAAEQALLGRKKLRDFGPRVHDLEGAPKSSLDGARVSVIAKGSRTHPDFRRFGIRSTEQLDAVGLVKRTGFEPEQFIPLVNVAAGDWLRRAQETEANALDKAAAACGAKKIPAIRRNLPVVRPFRFDASALYASRWPDLLSQIETPETPQAAREWGELAIRPLLDRMGGQPPSYVACLVADGDHMGTAIDSLATPADNRNFSRALAEFPGQARRIVETDHLGSLVYAGGDDVLAFLPVATAIDCADALAKAFAGALQDRIPSVPPPTLSVGIGIAHVMEAMGSLLALGRTAERTAKNAGRNALAVIAEKRSGGQRQFARSWTSDPISRLKEDERLLDGRLSTGKLHELEALLRRFPATGDPAGESAFLAAAFFSYANELLRHTDTEREAVSLKDLGIEGHADDYRSLCDAVRTAIDRVLIVRTMREAGFHG
jgi:CRISPR-associated protein Cmr2